MTRRKRHLTQQDLRAMGASPGRLATRYSPEGRAEIRQLTSDANPASASRPPFGPGLIGRGEVNKMSEGER